MARLLDKFKPSDPITENEVTRIENYLEEELGPFFTAVKEHNPNELIGASGSFETFSALLAENDPERYHMNGEHAREIKLDDYYGPPSKTSLFHHGRKNQNESNGTGKGGYDCPGHNFC